MAADQAARGSRTLKLKQLNFISWIKDSGFALLSFLLLAAVVILSACSQKESFTTSGSSRYFVQDFNPPYLDILWVIDDRSPMNLVRDHMIEEAQKFFVRLDSIPDDYQMGITTMDTLKNRGALKPSGTVLTKSVGTLSQRVSIFGNLLSQIINLQTGAENTGFQAVLLSLNQHFRPRPGVPLVLVFISDGDDFSNFRSVTQLDSVDYFANEVLALKNNQAELVRAFSINYISQSNSTNFADIRCATRNNADIDKEGTGAIRSTGEPWFQDRYFRLATRLNGDTADLCSSFSENINLSGLRLKELTRRFRLDFQVSDLEKLRVIVLDKNQNNLNIPWSFDSATQEVVFETAPPEGSSIQIFSSP